MLNNFFIKAKLFGKTVNDYFQLYKTKFMEASKREKIFYTILVMGILGTIILIGYAIDKYKHVLLLILSLWIFLKIEKCYNNVTIPQQTCSVLVDEHAIYSCIYEAVNEIHDILNLIPPLSVRSIILLHPPFSDGFPRFFIKLRKNDFSAATTIEEVIAVLSQEIQRIFDLRRNEFVSDISGLYLETVKDCNDHFEAAIIPVTSQTHDYINRKILKESGTNDESTREDMPYDTKF